MPSRKLKSGNKHPLPKFPWDLIRLPFKRSTSGLESELLMMTPTLKKQGFEQNNKRKKQMEKLTSHQLGTTTMTKQEMMEAVGDDRGIHNHLAHLPLEKDVVKKPTIN